jgi:hypothetical protein
MDELKKLQKLSEEELTKDILMPLLERMGFENIEYCHGTDEYGRDIVFDLKEPLGDKIWWGSQVKSCDIHGDSRNNKGNATQIKNQINEAFDQPYYLYKESKKIKITQMIVFTSCSFKGNAKEILSQEFENKPVKFYDGNHVIHLLRKYKLNSLLSNKNIKSEFNSLEFKRKLLKECSNHKDKFRAQHLLKIWYNRRNEIKLTEAELDKVYDCILDGLLDRYSHLDTKIYLEILKKDKKYRESLIKKIDYLLNSIETYNHYNVEECIEKIILFIKMMNILGQKDIVNEISWEVLFNKIQDSLPRIKYDFQRNCVLFRFFELTNILPELFIEKSSSLSNKLKLMIYLLSGDIGGVQRITSLEKENLRLFIDTTQELLLIHISTSLKFSTYDRNRTKEILKSINGAIKKIKFKGDPLTQKWIFRIYEPKFAVLLLSINNQKREYNQIIKQKETYDLFGYISDEYSLIKIFKLLLKRDFNDLIKNMPASLGLPQLHSIIRDLYFFNKYDEIIDLTNKYKNILYNDYWGADILDYIAVILTKKGKYKEAKDIFDRLRKGGSDLTWKYYDLCKNKLIKK